MPLAQRFNYYHGHLTDPFPCPNRILWQTSQAMHVSIGQQQIENCR
jgi:hypothetical protein